MGLQGMRIGMLHTMQGISPGICTLASVAPTTKASGPLAGVPSLEYYAGAGPLTPAEMAEKNQIEKERRKQVRYSLAYCCRPPYLLQAPLAYCCRPPCLLQASPPVCCRPPCLLQALAAQRLVQEEKDREAFHPFLAQPNPNPNLNPKHPPSSFGSCSTCSHAVVLRLLSGETVGCG